MRSGSKAAVRKLAPPPDIARKTFIQVNHSGESLSSGIEFARSHHRKLEGIGNVRNAGNSRGLDKYEAIILADFSSYYENRAVGRGSESASPL